MKQPAGLAEVDNIGYPQQRENLIGEQLGSPDQQRDGRHAQLRAGLARAREKERAEERRYGMVAKTRRLSMQVQLFHLSAS